MAEPIIIVRENGLEIEVRLGETCKAPRLYSKTGGKKSDVWFIDWDDADYRHGEFEAAEEPDSGGMRFTWKGARGPAGEGQGGGEAC